MAVEKEDLWHVQNTLSEQAREGFDGVHSRLDVLNGRVGRGEVAVGQHDVRLRNIEKEVFNRRHADREPPKRTGVITQRDVQVTVATLTAAGAVLVFVLKVLPAILKLL